MNVLDLSKVDISNIGGYGIVLTPVHAKIFHEIDLVIQTNNLYGCTLSSDNTQIDEYIENKQSIQLFAMKNMCFKLFYKCFDSKCIKEDEVIVHLMKHLGKDDFNNYTTYRTIGKYFMFKIKISNELIIKIPGEDVNMPRNSQLILIPQDYCKSLCNLTTNNVSQLIQSLFTLNYKGVFHNDIKLENIVCCVNGPKFIDFGSAIIDDDCNTIYPSSIYTSKKTVYPYIYKYFLKKDPSNNRLGTIASTLVNNPLIKQVQGSFLESKLNKNDPMFERYILHKNDSFMLASMLYFQIGELRRSKQAGGSFKLFSCLFDNKDEIVRCILDNAFPILSPLLYFDKHDFEDFKRKYSPMCQSQYGGSDGLLTSEKLTEEYSNLDKNQVVILFNGNAAEHRKLQNLTVSINSQRLTSQTISADKHEKYQLLIRNNLNNFKKVSANCICAILDDEDNNQIFVKMQVSDTVDSLIGEVLYLNILNKLSVRNIFPIYEFHDFFDFTTTNSVVFKNIMNNKIPYLVLKAFHPPNGSTSVMTLQNCLNIMRQNEEYEKNILLHYLQIEVDTLLYHYSEFAKDIEMSHNDMHFNNILYDNDELKIIDFGRCHMNFDKVNEAYVRKNLGTLTNEINKVFSEYGVDLEGRNVDDYKDVLINHFQLQGKYAYLCDVATVTLNFIPYVPFDWPSWCSAELAGDSDIQFKINIVAASKTYGSYRGIQQNMFYEGLCWLGCCLFMFTLNTHYNQNGIVTIRRSEMVALNFILRNGVFHPATFSTYKTTAEALFDHIISQREPATGGGDLATPLTRTMAWSSDNEKHVKSQASAKNMNPTLEDFPSETIDFKFTPPLFANNDSIANMYLKICGEPAEIPWMHKENIEKWKETYKQNLAIVAKHTSYNSDLEEILLIVAKANRTDNAFDRPPPPKIGNWVGSGETNMPRKVCKDAYGKKYIRKSKQRVYLSSIKGKYRYTDKNKTHIILTAQNDRKTCKKCK